MMPIYLDYNATTPIDPAVREAMLPYLGEQFGNPSSAHAYGRAARDAVDKARSQLAALIGAKPSEIVFTGGGTEASNLAIKGVLMPSRRRLFPWSLAGEVLTSTIEHPATFGPCLFLRRFGCRTMLIAVDRYGRVDPDDFAASITRRTRLVTVMHSNNEVGTIQPIREIATVAHARGIVVHTDAAQSIGKVPIDVNELSVDLMTIAGHKFYAPKGVGALYVREGTTLTPFLHGAEHESGRRAGTENVAGIVALGMAAEIAGRELTEAPTRLAALRDRLMARLHASLGDTVTVNGHPSERLPNTLNVSFIGQIGSELLARVPEVAASTGSACHSECVLISPVLEAMEVPTEIAAGAIRLSVGRFTTEDEIDQAAELLIRAVRD